MRIRVSHQTSYDYATPAKGAIQIIRMTPRSHDGQHVLRWRIDLGQDCRLAPFEDAFGNLAYSFTAEGPLSRLRVGVHGEVETQETQGVVRGTIERFPPELFLRDTALTRRDRDIVAFATDVAGGQHDNVIGALHALNVGLLRELTFDTEATSSVTVAAEAFARRRGVCQDFAHIFIAAARQLEIPARYVAGHLLRADGQTEQAAGHAWAEAYVPDLGWVAFDPAHGISVGEAYIRVAVGLDSLSAAPIRGSVSGGSGESMTVS